MLAQKDSGIANAVVTLKEMSKSESRQYLAFLKEQQRRDQADLIWGAKREGKEEGREEGLAEGKTEGTKQTKRAIAINLLHMEMPDTQIINATGLTKEELDAVRTNGNIG